MLEFHPNTISSKGNYKLLSGLIVPRPIAFVTTLSSVNGVVNAAPFSYFNVASSEPPILSLSIGRRNGEPKDTARNLLHNREIVVHLCDERIAEDMNRTASSLMADQSELELTRLTTISSKLVKVPGIAEALVRLEGRLDRHITIENDLGETTTDLFLVRVVYYHVDERVYDSDKGYVLTDQLKPISRLAGNEYARLGERFELERP
ncbi:flavin reductase family protein [Gorillibacterium massiliense]|uniref:flavin reductase family protein n=1 Tax=Gorillibacterium massiliense TaxID=1280390 RepID=UPI0004B1BCF8|nr:flavin reductase family protein [Gorillibacterium massiliense]